MAKFKITKSTTVAELKQQFGSEVGGVLRVYEGRSEAPEDAALVSLGAKEGELECRASRTVGKFEEAFKDELGLKVKVYTKDNWVAVLDGITLATVREIPKGTTKAKMEQFLAYQRDEKEVDAEPAVYEEVSTSDEMDVKDGWDASQALASQTESAAAAFHKLGDGYDDENEMKANFEKYPSDYLIVLKKDGKFTLYKEKILIPGTFDSIIQYPKILEADEVYYCYRDEIATSEEAENLIYGRRWGNEDYSLPDAIEDVLWCDNEYKWPSMNVDFIYNGKVFYSFNLEN